jgi:hypothetical protein
MKIEDNILTVKSVMWMFAFVVTLAYVLKVFP